MTNTYNMAGIEGNVMVPVISETGSLMAYLLYPDPTGVLGEAYCSLRGFRQHPENIQTTSRELNTSWGYYKNVFGCTGQPIIPSLLKPKKMAKVKANTGVSGERVKTDAAFERTRENMEEFGRAGKAAKLLRNIFRDVTVNAKDIITQARLLKVTSRVLMADPVNARGERTVNNGDLQQLQNFNFNARAGIGDVLFVRYTVSFNRVSGEVTINIPAFVPRNSLQNANGATHFRLMAAAAAVNFDTEQHEYAMQPTAELPFNNDSTQPTTLTLTLPANSKDSLVAVLGIEYYQQVNSRSYALKSGKHNASTIVLVDKAA